MNKRRLPLRGGGVMRCCGESLDAYESNPNCIQSEGTKIDCLYCPSGLIVRDGAWEWDQTNNRERKSDG